MKTCKSNTEKQESLGDSHVTEGVYESDFQKRIGWEGDVSPLLQEVCATYDIGTYQSHQSIPIGYEDFNLILTTDRGAYMVKAFAEWRDKKNCDRYIKIMTAVIDAGVSHPKLYNSSSGHLYETVKDGTPIRLCVMEYIDGESWYDSNTRPTLDDVPFFANQATRIHSIDLQPEPFYNEWSIVHFLAEYEKKRLHLTEEDAQLLAPLVKKFASLDITSLPHCFAHGDIIKTNVLQAEDGSRYIIDFSISGTYPRIQEHAVLLCNVLFDEDSPDTFMSFYDRFLSEYQKGIVLTNEELEALPLFVKTAHAMHLLNANYEKVRNGNSAIENQYWLDLGRKGLQYFKRTADF